MFDFIIPHYEHAVKALSQLDLEALSFIKESLILLQHAILMVVQCFHRMYFFLVPHYEHAIEALPWLAFKALSIIKESLTSLQHALLLLSQVVQRFRRLNSTLLLHYEHATEILSERAIEATSVVTENLILLRNAIPVPVLQGYHKSIQQIGPNLLPWVLYTLGSLLLALLISFVASRLYKRTKQRLEASSRSSSSSGTVGEDQFQSVRQSETSNHSDAPKFFQLSRKLCRKTDITVPPSMVIKSSQVWDITLGPRKKGDMLSPMTTVFKKHKHKKCRIALEIIRPERKSYDSNTKRLVVSYRKLIDGQHEEEVDPTFSGEYLADDEKVTVRIYRRRKKNMSEQSSRGKRLPFNFAKAKDSKGMSNASERTLGSQSEERIVSLNAEEEEEEEEEDESDDDETDDFYKEGSVMLFPPDMKEWVSYKEYPGKDCRLRKSNGNVIETKFGSGLIKSVRDITFQSTQERESFEEFCNEMMRLNTNRIRRQLDQYHEEKRENISEQTPVDSPTTADTQLSSDDEQEDEDKDETIRLLIEIVSATDLPVRFGMDPYVVVRMGDKVIHKTSVLVQTKNPIWTIKTGGLCLFSVSPENLVDAGGNALVFSLKLFNTLSKHVVIGTVNFNVKELLACKGERVGYDINRAGDIKRSSDPMMPRKTARLFLKIREATTSDVEFMRDLESNYRKDGVYSGETLLPLRPPQSTLLKRQHKEGEESEDLYRVRPFPDPEREEETTWLSSDDIYKESMLTSTYWVETGSGNVGQLYVEILGCSKLPNMDRAILGRKTDAFASIVFEDAAVTTDVIGQSLNPRWMPWSRRAFVFNIENPSSALFIGIFDHDPAPIDIKFMSALNHDPIGRIEVQLSVLQADTIYTLAYPLYFGDEIEEHNKKETGKVWVRLRLRWPNFGKAMLAGTTPAPPTVVSMARPRDYRVVKYTTVGPRNDTGFNIWKFTEYISELQNYEFFWVYFKDFAFNTWLWRGHYKLKIRNLKVLLPLHSIIAFFWGVAVTHNFDRLPSFFLFSIGWVLLACNEAVNRNPSPWHKNRNYFTDISCLLLNGQPDSVAVAPYQQLRTITDFDAARKKRDKWMERERELLNEQQMQLQLDLQGFDGEEYSSVLDITTGSARESLLMRFLFPLKPVLYPLQKQMRQVVISCRVYTSVLFWEKSTLAFWITTASFVGSVAIYKIPFSLLIVWMLRISAWVFLGPWMLLVDLFFFNDPRLDAMTDEERDERIRDHMREQYEEMRDKALNYQIRKEDIVKMESMKSYMFGSYHVRVPRFRETRFKDTPLPESFAEPYISDDSEPITIAERKYGQKLSGGMIPKTEFEAYCTRDDFDGRRKSAISFLEEQMHFFAPSRLLAKTRDVRLKNLKTGLRLPHIETGNPGRLSTANSNESEAVVSHGIDVGN